MTGKIILVTGAAGRFGRLCANALAQGGYTVYAAMRETAIRHAGEAGDIRAYALHHGLDLRVIEVDLRVQTDIDSAVARIVAEHGRIDVVVHNAGHGAFGPAEAFTPEQFAALYDIAVVSAHRLNRSVLPHMRRRRQGLLVWLSCSSTAGGAPPYISPHLAAKAGMDALAVQYARELARWGIETSIIVPGAYARPADQPAGVDRPADAACAAEYEAGPCAGLARQVREAAGRVFPEDADPAAVAGAVACVVDTPAGERPFRVHVDPGADGAAVAFSVIDRVRDEMLTRMGLGDLLKPAIRPAGV